MLKRSAILPRKRNAPRPAEKSATAFLQFLRGRDCFLADKGGCLGRIEAAHVPGTDKGVGTKRSDVAGAIPMCSAHHAEQHRIGWGTFQAKYGFNAVDVAGDYWSLWPGRVAWLRKLEAGR